MALDDVVKSVERMNSVAQTEEALRKDPYSQEARGAFGRYMQTYEGIGETDARTMGETMNMDTMRKQLVDLKGGAQQNLVEIARTNYDAILGALPKDELADYALRLGKVPITAELIDDVVKTKNFGALKETLKRKYSKKVTKDGKEGVELNKYWASYVDSIEDPNILVQLSQSYAVEERNKFIAKNIGDEVKDEKGKKKYVLDPFRLNAYIRTKVDGLKPEKQMGAYLDLASLYAAYKQSKEPLSAEQPLALAA